MGVVQLDYEVAEYDEDEIARLAALGITDVNDDPTVLVEGAGQSSAVVPQSARTEGGDEPSPSRRSLRRPGLRSTGWLRSEEA